ncbi:MAG: class I SAM-dependent methyltransferase [Sphingomonadales bacterium]|nr:class I SAM-dependent methyltransferase [Sphingomonadales bacterium]
MPQVDDKILKDLPCKADLEAIALSLGQRNEVAKRVIEGLQSGRFFHPDGRSDTVDIRLDLDQLGLIAHLAPKAPKPLCIDIGFGMGSSSAICLAAREDAGLPLDHVVFDPFGLGGGRGEVVEEYLHQSYGDAFQRIWKLSELGLPALCEERGVESAGYVFIDGDHRFEAVMADFVFADLLCAPGGFIILDDASFPAIETVVNFIRANRHEMEVHMFPAENCCLLHKTRHRGGEWSDFEPFAVPHRSGWTRA